MKTVGLCSVLHTRAVAAQNLETSMMVPLQLQVSSRHSSSHTRGVIKMPLAC
jgi:hypothetical protein